MRIQIIQPWNNKPLISECGEPTNLFANDTQLFSGDEVKIKMGNCKSKLGVVEICHDNIVRICTNKEVKMYYDTERGTYKTNELELVRSFKEYKNGEYVANGIKYLGFLVNIVG